MSDESDSESQLQKIAATISNALLHSAVGDTLNR